MLVVLPAPAEGDVVVEGVGDASELEAIPVWVEVEGQVSELDAMPTVRHTFAESANHCSDKSASCHR